jgi:hypothetical protein
MFSIVIIFLCLNLVEMPKKITKKEVRSLLKAKNEKLMKALAADEGNTALDTLYVLNNTSNDVTLEILMGDKGQSFDLSVTLDDNILANHKPSDFLEKVIGTNSNLNGKVLRVAANIMDLSKETNLTTLTITLKGGKANRKFPLAKSVNAEGESVDYACRIEFFIP